MTHPGQTLRTYNLCVRVCVWLSASVQLGPLAIFHPPLKYLGGCFWLLYRLGREAPISQNRPKGQNMATMSVMGHILKDPKGRNHRIGRKGRIWKHLFHRNGRKDRPWGRRADGRPSGPSVSRSGQILHTRHRKSDTPLEHATESPSGNSSKHPPLDKWQSFGQYR